MAKKTDTFLGANTPFGFVSLFSELYDPYQNCNAYIIKGGPGTGKSSLMRKIAARAIEKGFDTECVHCGSDPDSLDAVLVPALSLSICDGTAPHTMEPKFPGACENILNLGAFWNSKQLHENADEIRRLSIENSLYHRRATRFLSAAGSLHKEIQSVAQHALLEEKINGYALRFCNREFPKKKSAAPGKRYQRYLSGITPKGSVFYEDTVYTLARRVIAVKDELFAAAGLLLDYIGNRALANGYDVIFCPDPMQPKNGSAQLIVPEAGVALLAVDGKTNLHREPSRTMHAQRFLDADVLSGKKQYLSLQKEMARALTDQGIAMLRQAKAVHDELERCYIDAMDFDALNAYGDRLLETLFV